MDCLSVNHVLIYYGQQKIVFPNSSESESMSTQQVWPELKGGSSCFIILTQIGVKNEDEMSNIHVVKEFVDVFLEEIPGLRENWNLPLIWYLELNQCQWDHTEWL